MMWPRAIKYTGAKNNKTCRGQVRSKMLFIGMCLDMCVRLCLLVCAFACSLACCSFVCVPVLVYSFLRLLVFVFVYLLACWFQYACACQVGLCFDRLPQNLFV